MTWARKAVHTSSLVAGLQNRGSWSVTQDWRGIGAFKKTCKCPAGRSELTPPTWAPLGHGRPPTRLRPGPEMLLSSRPRKGVARAPDTVPAQMPSRRQRPRFKTGPQEGRLLRPGSPASS